MTAPPPDNHGAEAVQVATGDEMFEPGEAPMPLATVPQERIGRKPGGLPDMGGKGKA